MTHKAVQNNNSGTGTQTNNNNSGSGTLNTPQNTGSGILVSPINSGSGTLISPSNIGSGKQSFIVNPIYNKLPKFEKRALIDITPVQMVRVIDSAKNQPREFVFPFQNVGNLPAVNLKVKTFVIWQHGNRITVVDSSETSTIDTLGVTVSREKHQDLKNFTLKDTLLFYMKVSYSDTRKHTFEPKPLVFIFRPKDIGRNLIIVDSKWIDQLQNIVEKK